jgi:hypothetical protein
MKKFIAIIAAAGLVLTMSGIAMSEETGNRTVTQVSAISEPGANGNPGALILDSAAICSVPNMVADADIIYDYKLLSFFLPAGADAIDLDSAPDMVSGADTIYNYTLLNLFSHAGADAIDLAVSGGMTRNLGPADLVSCSRSNLATAYDK